MENQEGEFLMTNCEEQWTELANELDGEAQIYFISACSFEYFNDQKMTLYSLKT